MYLVIRNPRCTLFTKLFLFVCIINYQKKWNNIYNSFLYEHLQTFMHNIVTTVNNCQVNCDSLTGKHTKITEYFFNFDWELNNDNFVKRW